MISQVVVLLVLARFLDAAQFGLASLALVIIGFSEIFTQMGVGPALVQRADLTRAHIASGRSLAVMTGVIFGGILWLIAPAIEQFFSSAGLGELLRMLAPVFVVQGLAVASESLLQRDLEFRRIAKITAASQVLGYGLVAIVCAYLGLGAWSIIFAHLAKCIVRSTLMILFSQRIGFALSYRASLDLLRFGAGFSIAKIFNFIAVQGDNLVVAKLLGAAPLGYYGRAYYFVETSASFVGNSVDQVLFPALAQVQDDKARAERAYRRAVMLISIVFLPLSAFMTVNAHDVVVVLLGKGWEPVVVPLQILAIGIAMRAGYRISDSLARAMGAVYRRAWRQAIYAALVVFGAWIGHFWGIVGVAAAVSLALVVNYLMMLQLGRELVGGAWSRLLGAHAPGIAIGVLVAILGAPLSWSLTNHGVAPVFVLASACLVFGVTYLSSIVIVLRLLPMDDREWLIHLVAQRFTKLREKISRRKGQS